MRSYSEFFAWLKSRGLKGVDLVVSDDHKGLVNAVMTHFQGASWQRAHVHFIRNVLEACPKSLHRKLHARLRHMFDAPDLETARRILELAVQEFESLAPRAVGRLEAGFEDALER